MAHYVQKAANVLSRSIAAGSVLAMLSAGTAAAGGFEYGYGRKTQQYTVLKMDNDYGNKCYDRCELGLRDRCRPVKPVVKADTCDFNDECRRPLVRAPNLHKTANINNSAHTDVDSVINAASVNTTNVSQHGGGNMGYGNWCGLWNCGAQGGSQDATVHNDANTTVDSVINAGAANTVDVDQGGGYGFLFQNADINADADTNVHSEINAVSSNETTVDQSGGGYQNADVHNGANTDVHSEINAGSANTVDVDQN
ncbi:MAG: hypothetical protein WCV62_03660 [Candidatus Peribacteraceae bacterium]|jgi:hypothetical protein